MNNAIVPVPNTQKDFYDWSVRRRLKLEQARERSHDLIFIGDSITHLFEVPGHGAAIWSKYYDHYHPMNLGYGWDCVQNVLWRLENGEFEEQRPKLVVLNIGTNNLTGNSGGRANTAEEIAMGIETVVRMLQAKSPQTTVLVMAIFPRGLQGDEIFWKVKSLNDLLESSLNLSQGILFMDIGDRFLGPDGEIPKEIFHDGVHPTEKGYAIWAEAIEAIVEKKLQ